MTKYRWPLMKSAFHADDFRAVQDLLECGENSGMWNLDARLTMGEQVAAFEEEFAAWQGCKFAVMVNSGASANLITMHALSERMGGYDRNWKPKVIVPTVTWASDITSVMHAGFEPVFVDVDRDTLGMDHEGLIEKVIEGRPAAVFTTHCMGFNSLDDGMLGVILNPGIPLIEDCCESIGATDYTGKKVGNFGLAANFSFYYAHPMTTIEGGMVTTDDKEFADLCRMLRNHGMTRGVEFAGRPDDDMDLDPNFTFAVPGFNVRPTEISAAIGRSQLKRLDENIKQRHDLACMWYGRLGTKYQSFDCKGASPYGLLLVLRDQEHESRPLVLLRNRVEALLREKGVEYRKGVAGGGNQLRMPYLRRLHGDAYRNFPVAEHLHSFGIAIGLWPGLEPQWIEQLALEMNKL